MKIFVLFINLVLYTGIIYSQTPGEWTWMKGSSGLNYTGVYGLQGIPSPSNNPPSLYEACEWTDNFGNFWLYGGLNNVDGMLSDLWKFEVDSQMWTWIKGPGGICCEIPVPGVQGQPSVLNTPGFRTTSYTWTDLNNNLWLFGGISDNQSGAGTCRSDLYMFNISSNNWTWMKGATNPNQQPVFGNIGVEDPLNNPGCLAEMGVSWTADDGKLWLLDDRGRLWRYNIATNNWAWMKGDTTTYNPNPVYGTKGIAHPSNTPGKTFFDYSRWKDSNGDFWYLASGGSNYFRALWKYTHSDGNWTWVWGDTVFTGNYRYGSEYCLKDKNSVEPKVRAETRSIWIDACDNLWLMGGSSLTWSSNPSLNDLVYFDPLQNDWVWVDNDTTGNPGGSYGLIGVSSPTNKPAARSGAMPFKDKYGNFWLFGGAHANYYNTYGDLWRYVMDSTCTQCYTNSVVENPLENNVTFFPNPSNGSFSVETKEQIDEVFIYDYNGKLIHQENDIKNRHVFNLKIDGLYFVKYKIKEVFYSEKIVVVN